MIDRRVPEQVSSVLDRHRDEFVRTYGAIGSAVGKAALADDEYVIVVYLRTAADVPPEKVSIEDVPVKFVVTGEVRPQGSRGG